MSASKSVLRTCLNTRQQPALLPRVQCRHESTARRHKKLLALPEAPSYTPSRSEPSLIFNPPSSAPSVYHTPLKFLPANDKRRSLYSAALSYSNTTALRRQASPVASPGTPLSAPSHLPPRPSAALPPPVRAPYAKKYHLDDAQIAEIRRLRLGDPEKWTRVKLAERFGCSQFFVGMLVKVPEKAARIEGEHQAAREKWGRRRREAREEREKRKVLWGRDL
ncbi:mitochondrial ribosomal protein subunit L20-domain-containing protein [Boeremia exigua]|uniref:mitochondrial ribosomal protein subunit L20-domain-containing protein n=1 Tax=Boeremia exigua TaxID=749465 RepID=UPI001E8EAE52|nr:mitochondrial ribosomal protein subunit L20-domain-containing protein [Boeremia exigua]KAH6633679.1 mitochondrial ribosomal protein subunit L20-domain-containing protein [Boeremia exigua]